MTDLSDRARGQGRAAILPTLVERAGRYWWWAVPLAAGGVARLWFDAASRGLQPQQFPDSRDYLEIATQAPRLAHLFFAKPAFVPAFFRMADGDPQRIVALQQELAFWSWFAVAVALFLCLRSWPAKLLGLGIGLAFMLAPLRIGWTGGILAESVNDSLMGLLVALAVWLIAAHSRVGPGRVRTSLLGVLWTALALAGVAWLLSRDTNAATALVAVPVAWFVWAGRGLPARRLVRVFAAGVVVASAGALWTAEVEPPQPTGLTLNEGWDASVTPRARYPMFNNLFGRVVPDAEALGFFASRGMPMAAELPALDGPEDGAEWRWDRDVLSAPEFEGLRQWVVEHGTLTYVTWLLRSPLDRLDEVSRDSVGLLAGHGLDFYMPPGWEPRALDLTSNAGVVLALLVASPLVLRHARRSRLAGLALVLVVSGGAGMLAAYYGDAIEIPRHSYGAAQQVVLGLLVGLAAWVDLTRADVSSTRDSTTAA